MRTCFRIAALGVAGLAAPAAAQWQSVPTGTTAEFRGLDAADERTVWAAGRGGVVARSLDGGRSWAVDTIAGAEALFLIDVAAFGRDTAIVLGTDFDGGLSRFYRTVDGGSSWSLAHEVSGAGVFLDGLAFWDAQRGVAFGDPVDGGFMVLLTSDGGVTWRRVAADRLPPPLEGEAGYAASGRAVDVGPGGRAWFATGGGPMARVIRSTDHGETWDAVATPMRGGQGGGLFGVSFRDGRVGLAVGGNHMEPRAPGRNVLRSEDGGASWRLVAQSEPAGVRYGGAWIPGGDAYVAVGPSGSGVSLDGGATWIAIDAASFNTVVFASAEAGWAAGTGGRIVRWTGLPEPVRK